MSNQNPIIPSPTQAKGIDAVILDIQTHLDNSLSWLTNGMGRAYRMAKVRSNQTVVFLPEVYLGTATSAYYAATPDNDKTGQSIFILGDETLPSEQLGFYGWLQYPVSIIFNANLKLIDSTLLLTEDFTEHLIADVRQALIRDLFLLGKPYQLTIDDIQREFEDVYSEFDVQGDRGVAHLPMTHFRVNCTLVIKESCLGTISNRCTAILQNLTSADLLDCILPTYDFSTTAVQDALTVQQVTDIEAAFCTPVVAPTRYAFSFDGVNESLIGQTGGVYDIERNEPYSVSGWIKRTGAMVIVSKFLGQTGYAFIVTATGQLLFEQRGGAYIGGRAIEAVTAAIVPVGTWCNVIQTYDGSGTSAGLKMYLNGTSIPFTVIVDVFTTFSMINAANITIGNFISSILSNGLMNNTVMWNIALSPADVLTEATGIAGVPLETPVQAANVIMKVNVNSSNSKFGYDVFTQMDESLASTNYRSVNMEITDLSTDVPT